MDLLQSGGIGGAGALFGAFLTWAGFKSRLDSQEARLVQLEKDVVYGDTCKVCKSGTDHGHTEVMARMDKLENVLKQEVRALIIAVAKQGGQIT
jgi:hypothetical protein